MAFKFFRILRNLYFRLIVLIVSTVVIGGLCVAGWKDSWDNRELTLFYLALAFLVWSLYMIIRSERANCEKIGLMLEAVRNDDFLFRFPTHRGSAYDIMLNESLNRMNQLLSDAKKQTVERERYYDLILESVTTGIAVLDHHGFVRRCNPSALRLLGLSNLTQLSQLDAIDPELRKAFETITSDEKRHLSIKHLKEGEVHYLLRCSEVQLKGEALRIIAFNDIRSEMEEKEMESWIRLTRVLTHEIMNSIAPIHSLSDTLLMLLRSGEPGDIPVLIHKQLSEGLEVIGSTSRGLMSFVDSYRKFSSLQKPVPQLVYVKDLLMQIYRLQIQDSAVEWHVSVDPEDLLIYVDENLIRHVLINLVRNAIQAGAGRIGVRSYCMDDESVIVEVSNDGEPIPEAEAEQIFVPFFTTKSDGSGIGLSVSRQIMKMSGGNISLCRVPADGYRVTFELKFN